MVCSDFIISSCAEIRLLTYPADFTWIGKEHLKTAMHGMANSVGNINELLENDTSSISKQDNILKELDRIETYALSLSGESEWSVSDTKEVMSNHLLLNEQMDVFIEKIVTARLQVQSEPANYYGVGKITGECSSCHRLR